MEDGQDHFYVATICLVRFSCAFISYWIYSTGHKWVFFCPDRFPRHIIHSQTRFVNQDKTKSFIIHYQIGQSYCRLQRAMWYLNVGLSALWSPVQLFLLTIHTPLPAPVTALVKGPILSLFGHKRSELLQKWKYVVGRVFTWVDWVGFVMKRLIP